MQHRSPDAAFFLARAWRSRLRRELIWIALAKAAALTLLWILFFRGSA